MSKKFWLDVADGFVIAALTVVVMDPSALIAAGSIQQLVAAATALGRAALIAGFQAVAPRFIAVLDRYRGA